MDVITCLKTHPGQKQAYSYSLRNRINKFSRKFREFRFAFQTGGDIPDFISFRVPVVGHELGKYHPTPSYIPTMYNKYV